MSNQKKYDIVVFGATGFTGQFVLEEVARTIFEENGLTWAVAGRSMEKLQQCLRQAAKITDISLDELPIIIADINCDPSLQEMCSQAKLILNCVGPYRFYGDPVVRACIENGTHHLDISGEPGFLEKVQLLYSQKAREAGSYIVGACGWDSVPVEMGMQYTKDNFDGDLNSVEGCVAIKFGPDGGGLNTTTWKAAIHGFAHSKDTFAQRKLLFPDPLPRSPHRQVNRPTVFYNEAVKGWCLPFPGSDRSVVYRTQRYNYEQKKERPIQFNAYFRTPSLIATVFLIIIGVLFGVLARFSCGRYLLEKFPRLFSAGMFSTKGPSRKQIAGASFIYSFVGRGYNTRIADPDEQHTDKPNHGITTRITGPEAGYVATPICLVQCAYCVLREGSKLPSGGGVFTPGAAFAGTSLIERLQNHNIKFQLIDQF